MSKRPGFVSPTGIVVAAVLLVVVVALTLVVGPLLFSPGGLNSQAKAATLGGVSTHAQLAKDCGACHPAPWSSQTMADKCLACHARVATEIKAKSGVHGHLTRAQSSPTCRGCHPEHHGATGALTSLDVATFPHDQTGFSLRSHKRMANGARFTCADCHPKGYGAGAFDQSLCADCHATIDAKFMSQHEATFGKDCLPCHDGSGRMSVDHSKFAFKLTGKHSGLDCKACHANAKSLQDYQSTPQDCYSCHAKDDKHNGSFGKQCDQCHGTGGWGGANFDHKIFPVNHGGDKQKATCKTCHPVKASEYTCLGCHQHTDATVRSDHEGKSAAQLADCIRCHPGGKQAGD